MTVDKFFSLDITKYKQYEEQFLPLFDSFVIEAGVSLRKDTIGNVHRWTYSLENTIVDIGYITEEQYKEVVLRFCIVSSFSKDAKFISELKKEMNAPEVTTNEYLLYLLQYISHRGL